MEAHSPLRRVSEVSAPRGVGGCLLQHGVNGGDEWFCAPDAGEDGAVANDAFDDGYAVLMDLESCEVIQKRELTQQESASILGTVQPRVSALLRG